jgi:hypothetical protein
MYVEIITAEYSTDFLKKIAIATSRTKNGSTTILNLKPQPLGAQLIQVKVKQSYYRP